MLADEVEKRVEQAGGFAAVPDGAEFEGLDVEGEDADELIVVGGVGLEGDGDAVAGGDAADEAFGRGGGFFDGGGEAAESAELIEKRAIAGRLLFVEDDPGFGGEVGEADGFFAGARVLLRDDGHDASAHHGEDFELAGAAEDGAGDEAEMGAARADGSELIMGAQVAQADFDLGEAAVKLGNDAGDELATEAPVVTDDEFTAEAAGGLAGSGGGDVDLRENFAGVGEEDASGIGELHRVIAVEEGRAEVLLECADLPAERGLGDAELLGGAAEVEQLGDGLEVAEMT